MRGRPSSRVASLEPSEPPQWGCLLRKTRTQEAISPENGSGQEGTNFFCPMSVGAVRGRRLGEAEILPWTSFHSCPSSAEGTALGPVTVLYGHRVGNLPATAAGTGKH